MGFLPLPLRRDNKAKGAFHGKNDRRFYDDISKKVLVRVNNVSQEKDGSEVG